MAMIALAAAVVIVALAYLVIAIDVAPRNTVPSP